MPPAVLRVALCCAFVFLGCQQEGLLAERSQGRLVDDRVLGLLDEVIEHHCHTLVLVFLLWRLRLSVALGLEPPKQDRELHIGAPGQACSLAVVSCRYHLRDRGVLIVLRVPSP